ncbi:uncharacterized protein LOC114287983 isoform X1 [Camellia sinensis]|uniref:uncharacterized protein LOC114287983 isoform X1 n=1 Tax=Camellia sinensis TaxID=4442 RepID=UPI001036480C|nr:uncharacterized protein LOC114287983 isoform X1 [Camellia sinensis]
MGERLDRVQKHHMHDNFLRKGINPRSRAQQLQDPIQEYLQRMPLVLNIFGLTPYLAILEVFLNMNHCTSSRQRKKRQQQRQNEKMAKRHKLQHLQQHARLIALLLNDREGNAGFVVFEFVDYSLHPCPVVWLRNTSFLMRATSCE